MERKKLFRAIMICKVGIFRDAKYEWVILCVFPGRISHIAYQLRAYTIRKGRAFWFPSSIANITLNLFMRNVWIFGKTERFLISIYIRAKLEEIDFGFVSHAKIERISIAHIFHSNIIAKRLNTFPSNQIIKM